MSQHDPQHGEPHPGHTDCSEVLHRIYEYLDGEMSASDVVRVAAHLHECTNCLNHHDLERTMKTLVQRSHPVQPAPTTLRVQIVRQITTIRIETDLP